MTSAVSGERSGKRRAEAVETGPRPVGSVGELWRYPVKSMLGEQTTELLITEQGSLGDRTWALRDLTSGRIASAKKFPRLLEFRATYEVEPTLGSPGRARIQVPGGRVVHPDEDSASAVISEVLGHPMRLESQAGSYEKTGIDPETVFGDVPVQDMKPEWTPETMPDYFQLKQDTFFEIGSIYVLASGSVDHLRELQGGTARIDRRRFRPNIYVHTTPEWSGFVEDAWIGGTLAVGESLLADKLQPTVWCVTSTLAQEDLPRDLSVLRTTAQHHGGCLGVYASVKTSGRVGVSDPVMLQT
jgi:uncharacterized protein YcbX